MHVLNIVKLIFISTFVASIVLMTKTLYNKRHRELQYLGIQSLHTYFSYWYNDTLFDDRQHMYWEKNKDEEPLLPLLCWEHTTIIVCSYLNVQCACCYSSQAMSFSGSSFLSYIDMTMLYIDWQQGWQRQQYFLKL